MTLVKSLLLVASAAGLAAPQQPPAEPPYNPSPLSVVDAANESSGSWFVELSGAPVADGASLAAVRAEKAAFRAAARAAGIRFTERFAYDHLWNGLSITVSRSQLSKLSAMPGVKNLYPVVPIALPPTVPGPSTELYTAIAMTGADVVQSELGYTGSGVRVAVVDTGIDYEHPDLGGCFGPGCRVEKGWDFVGDAFNADSASPSYNPVAVPDEDPDDCAGHGTHVSGIIGANGGIKGVAPGVTFYAYRVFGCQGSTFADIMIAAMERALADGAQVVNMSIGSAFQWPQYPTAQAADRLVNRGVAFVASIGNNGSTGLYSAGAPGVGQKVIGVASFDNSHVYLPYFTVSADSTPIGYAAATGAPAPPTTGSLPMARTGTPASAADGCSVSPPAPGSLVGYAVLIRRGGCTFNEKVANAQLAGASAAIIYNNVAGPLYLAASGTVPIMIPVVGISDTQGVLINDRLAAGAVTMTWTAESGSFPYPAGGVISSFSSYGLAPDLSLKPDIAAPGGMILSTHPLELGSYATYSGTSMASPHVAGAVALLLEARPNLPPLAVRSILQNTAVPQPWWGNRILGLRDNVHRQGAGMLRIDNAILSTTRIEPGKLSLGESEAGPVTSILTVRNDGSSPITYDISHEPALATGSDTFTVSFWTAFAALTFDRPAITIRAGRSAEVAVTVTAPPVPPSQTNALYGGYIVFTPRGGGQVYRVPYAGFAGDYQSIQVLAPTAYEFPWLVQLVDGWLYPRPAGGTFTMTGEDVPYLFFHLAHQSRMLRIEAFDSVSGKAWGRVFNQEYLGRNSGVNSYFSLGWDGTTASGRKIMTVPNGSYVLKLSVLKALGDAENAAHWEVWTSPVITIARP